MVRKHRYTLRLCHQQVRVLLFLSREDYTGYGGSSLMLAVGQTPLNQPGIYRLVREGFLKEGTPFRMIFGNKIGHYQITKAGKRLAKELASSQQRTASSSDRK